MEVPRHSLAERDRRWALARQITAAENVQALIACGGPGCAAIPSASTPGKGDALHPTATSNDRPAQHVCQEGAPLRHITIVPALGSAKKSRRHDPWQQRQRGRGLQPAAHDAEARNIRPGDRQRMLVDHAYIVAGGEITKATRAWIGNDLDASQRRSIIFMDRDDILNLYVVTNLPVPGRGAAAGRELTRGSMRRRSRR
jgi:hypothetical protein